VWGVEVKNDFIIAINQVATERQLSKEVVLEAVEAALLSAYKRDFGSAQNVVAKIDLNTGQAHIYAEWEVVPEVTDRRTQLSLEEARQIDPNVESGSRLLQEITPGDFGRIAAQTAKQVILQRIREAERDALYTTYSDMEGEIIHGTVQSINSQAVTLSLGKAEAILPKSEQIPVERYRVGQRLRAYVVEVSKTNRGPQIIVSRTHRSMLRRLLELEVPEIFNGTVEIKSIAREAGSRSKVAVAAVQEGIDPVGSCVGMRGVRIQNIVNELNGEKIDVVAWSPDVPTFIANALSPAKVMNVMLEEGSDGKTATVVVPDKQLSLAIGKEGQNARLAAKLTGWRIDIKSATEAAEEALRKAEVEQVRAVAGKQQDILALAEAILRKKDGATLSDSELMALGQAIQVVEAAEEAAAKVAEEPVAAAEEAVAEVAEEPVAAAEEAIAGVAEVQEVAEPAEVVTEAPGEAEVVEEAKAAAEEETEAGEEIFAEYLEAEEAWVDIEGEEGEEDKTVGQRKKVRKKRRSLVYDEDLGQMVIQRQRKPGRQRGDWGESM
jgi:N utilization substance protein A